MLCGDAGAAMWLQCSMLPWAGAATRLQWMGSRMETRESQEYFSFLATHQVG
jgi:hypothetical protein